MWGNLPSTNTDHLVEESRFGLVLVPMKLKAREPTSRRIAALFVCLFGLQGAFAFWVTSILFYRAGAYFLDAGFYVYAIASEKAPNNPELVRQAWGNTVFLTHTTLSPMAIMGLLRPIFGTPMNFIMYLVLQHMMISIAGAVLMMVGAAFFNATRRQLILSGVFGSILLPLSNIGMGSLAYPHVEVFGASAISLGICLIVIRWVWSSDRRLYAGGFLLILVGMLAREDLGGHIAIAVTAAVLCSSFRSFDKQIWHRVLVLMGLGAGTTIAMMIFQRMLGSKGAFSISYSGVPAYAHITSIWYLLERILYLIGSRMDLMGALTGFIVGGCLTKRRELFAFPLAALPWILLNATAVDPSKNAMSIYGLFPMMIYLVAPLISMALPRFATSAHKEEVAVADSSSSVGARLVYILAIISFFFGGISAAPGGGGYVYFSMLRYPVVGPGEISLTNKLVRDFAAEGERRAVDDAVMSLNPVQLENTALISRISAYSEYDSILFYPAFILGEGQVINLFQGWINDGRLISLECLPGGLMRADAKIGTTSTPQTARGRFDAALRCHPRPHL